jgi:hypothetical protein
MTTLYPLGTTLKTCQLSQAVLYDEKLNSNTDMITIYDDGSAWTGFGAEGVLWIVHVWEGNQTILNNLPIKWDFINPPLKD